MTATRTRRFWAIVVAAGLWLVAAALLWRTSVPDLHSVDVRPGEVFGADFLARSARYSRGLRLFWIGATVAQLLALVGAVILAPRVRAKGILGGIALGVATLVAVWLAALPFVFGAQWWRRRYGVSRADYGTILVDPWLERLGSLAAAALAIGGLMLLARRFGDRWWIVGGPAFAAFGAAFLLAQPYLLVPRLKPLPNPQLEAEIKRLARLEGVGEVRIEVRDASRRTRAINAELYGVGPTKRIIIWDTALDGRLTPAEVAQLAAHEFGHVHANHVWKSIGWLFLFAVPGAYVIAVTTRRRGGLGRPEAVPVALLTITVLELALLPVTNLISRRYEAEADWLGMQATHRPAAQEGLIRELAEASLAQPEPPVWAYVLLDTHPPPMQRIATARSVEALPGGS